MELGGNEAGAHGDHDETVGVLGEGLGRRDSDGDLRRPKLEDESMRSSWGVRALGACSRRRNRRWRSLQTTRGGERSMVGVVAANDGGGSLIGRRTKRERGRRAASEGEERGPPGGFVASRWREGEARERLGGSRRWPRRARARQRAACLLWQEEAARLRGPAQCWAGQWLLGGPGRGLAPGKFFPLLFLFYFISVSLLHFKK